MGSTYPDVQPAQSLMFLHPIFRRARFAQIDAIAELGYGSASHYARKTTEVSGFSFNIPGDTIITVSAVDLSVGLRMDFLRIWPFSSELLIGISEITAATLKSNRGDGTLPNGSRVKPFLGIGWEINLSLSRRLFAEINLRVNQYFSPHFVYDSHGSSFPLEMGLIGLAVGVVLY